MAKINEKGFGLVEGIMAAATVVLLGAVVWFYFTRGTATEKPKESSSTNSARTNSTSSEATNIPKDWKTYINNTYGFSFSHPSDWTVSDLGSGQLAPDSPAADKSTFTIGILRPKDQDYAFNIDVTHETLQQAVDWQKKVISANYDGDAIKSELSGEKSFTVNNYPAKQLDITSIPQASPTKGGPAGPPSYTSVIYVSVKGLLYKFGIGYYDSPEALTSSTMMQVFNTLQIK